MIGERADTMNSSSFSLANLYRQLRLQTRLRRREMAEGLCFRNKATTPVIIMSSDVKYSAREDSRSKRSFTD